MTRVRAAGESETASAGGAPRKTEVGLPLAAAVLLPLLFYFALAGRLIGAGVGYEMDEALYVQSAVHLLRGEGPPPFVSNAAESVTLFGRRLPLMIIPYVGAVKAYVALPVFRIFGFGAGPARFAGVLLGGVGLAGFAVLVAAAAGPAAALAAGMLLAVHPSYLDYTVLDNGGVSVWMGGMGILGLTLAHRLRRPTAASAFLLGAAAGLAAWSRANLLWLIAAGAAAALFVFGRRARLSARDGLAAAAGGLVGSLPLVVYELASRFGTLRYIGKNRVPLTGAILRFRLRALAGVLVSDGEQRSIWWGPRAAPWELAVGALLLALTLACAFAGARSLSRETGGRRAFAATAVVLSAILLTSRLAVSQHHLVAVLPLVIGALSIAAFELGRREPRSRRVLSVAGLAFLALSLAWDFRIDQGLRRTGGKYGWSSALQQTADFLAAHPVTPERLKIVPWGFQNNLYVLTGGAVRGTELHWGATRSLSSRGLPWRAELQDGGSFLFFLFPSDPPPPALTGFSEALAEYSGPRRETIFRDRSGAPVIALLEIPRH